jgi:hypothetical protein
MKTCELYTQEIQEFSFEEKLEDFDFTLSTFRPVKNFSFITMEDLSTSLHTHCVIISLLLHFRKCRFSDIYVLLLKTKGRCITICNQAKIHKKIITNLN